MEMEENMVTLFAPKFINIYDCDCCYLTVTAISPLPSLSSSSSSFKVLWRQCKRSFPSMDFLVAVINIELRFNAFYMFIVTSSKK